MADPNVVKCHQCGKKVSTQKSADPSMPKVGHECAQCHQWTCGDCTDWNASDADKWVCSTCSGRVAPRKCGCD